MKSVLIVEDSATMRSMIAAALEELPRPVALTHAESGFEALRRLPEQAFDLILTDINIPDISGLELVSFVKRSERYREIPLVIVSTESTERDRERGMGLGADAYLVKPFDPGDLLEVASRLLGEE